MVPLSQTLSGANGGVRRIARECCRIASLTHGRPILTLGSDEDLRREAHELARRPEVLISTPGRVIDHLRRGSASLAATAYVGVDAPEGDVGFLQDVDYILSKTPKELPRQNGPNPRTNPYPEKGETT